MKIGDKLKARADFPMIGTASKYYVKKGHIYTIKGVDDEKFFIKSDYMDYHGCSFMSKDKYFFKSLALNKQIKIL